MWKAGLWAFDGSRIGAVHFATEPKISLPLFVTPTVSFQLRADNPMVYQILSRKRKVLLTLYQDGDLRFTGQCTVAEFVGADNQTLQCNFSGAAHFRLTKRLCGKQASPGIEFTQQVGGRGTIASSLLSTTNAERDTGIRVGTITGLYATDAGPWYYKPIAEAYQEMAVAKIYPFENPTLSSHTVWDAFGNAASHNNPLNGKQLEAPVENWATVVTGAGDFHVVPYNGGGRVVRGGTVENFAVAGSSDYGEVYFQLDFSHAAIEDNLSGICVRGGAPDLTSECLLALVSLTSAATTIDVRKRLPPSSDVSLGNVITGPLEVDQIMSLRLHVLNDGRWFVWFWPQNDTPVFPTLSGQDADLVNPGGALATGKLAMVDAGVTSSFRSYWSVRAKAPATAMTLQGFEYELVPSEPTVDGDGVKIATLNAGERIGTDRPEVIFEYGKGNRSVKEAHYILDATNQLTQAYTLTDVDVRVSKDQDAIDDDGLYEEVVPNDLGDAGLRAALADAHVLVRKQAKETVTFTPTASGTGPVFGTDYFVGDTVTARVSVKDSTGTEQVLVNGTVRVYGVEISIDDNGKEEINPVLVEE